MDRPGTQQVFERNLCDKCCHQQLVRNTRGSVFSLCLRSKTDPGRFPRYPRLPVERCQGYDPKAKAGTEPTARRA